MRKHSIRLGVWVGVVGAALATAAVAAAAGGAGSAPYRGVAGEVQSSLRTTGKSGTLPFTGLQLSLIVVAGIALALIGLTVRRVARQKS